MSLMRNRLLLAAALGHMTLDFFQNFLPVMLPLLMTSLRLNYAQTGLVVTVGSLTSSLTQPLFGHLADHLANQRLGLLGIIWANLFIVLAALAGNYPLLVVYVTMASLGSAAFHPYGAMNASRVQGNRRGAGFALFSLGGSIGYAMGPLLGGAYFAAWGLGKAGFLLLPAMLMFLFLLQLVRNHEPPTPGLQDYPPPGQSATTAAVFSLAVLLFLRAWVSLTLVTYIPLLYQAKGATLTTASEVLFLYLIAEAIGSFLGGLLWDRLGPRVILFSSLTMSGFFLVAFLHLSEPWPFLMVIPLGLFLASAYPVTVLLTQNLLPKRTGMASGLAMGSVFIAGGIGTAITGLLADRFGLLFALSTMILLPFIAALFSLVLSKKAVTKDHTWEVV